MKLSDYAKSIGVSYKTAWRMWKRGDINARFCFNYYFFLCKTLFY
ncbi:hypothetical protein GXM_06488 [Nostoc sphaeroides CCNUC1]|uniref:IS607 family transposase n=1 Tax=Nostoc sphaeroides CCNUC1 TaxID=2653204 RepID=A0A5P8W8K4_9NOSO|nr:hypothetical protein GXM_06488 [Nostoc sphaeroides CCNUC1]